MTDPLAALAASGPLALVLGIAVRVLWSKVIQLERELREQAERFDAAKDVLHRESKELLREINGTLEKLLEDHD